MAEQHAAASDVRAAFLQDFAKQLNTREIELPPFPDAYARILSALDDPDLSMNQVARVVTTAPDLCVRILRMANSALLNRAGIEVTDVDVAVARLGAATVRNAAVSLATQELFPIPKNSPLYDDLRRLHETSVKTAAWAYTLSGRAHLLSERDNAMLTGLLHNVGNFYILSRIEDFPEFADPETERAWAPGVGSAIIESWGFPAEIARAVELQADEDACHYGPADLRDLLIVSKHLAAIEKPEEEVLAALGRPLELLPAFAKLEIESDNLVAVMKEYEGEVTSFLSVFH